jgi:hypothetical protein
MTPADVPAVEEKLREQNARDSTSYSLPSVFDETGRRLPNIALALVAVDEETGEVAQGHIWEQTVEQMTFGIDPKATVCSMHEQEAVLYMLRNRGFRDMHILVPAERVEQMQHGLEKIYGMSATGLTHFYRMLDPHENEALKKFYEEREVTA